MGNTTSSKPGAEVAVGAYSPTSREGNVYDQSFIPAPASRSFSTPAQTTASYSAVSTSRVSPPLPPRGLDRRSQTMVIRHTSDRDSPRSSHTAIRRQSTSDMSAPSLASSEEDDLSTHVHKITPGDQEEDITLDSNIVVFFDKDVRAVNINKLFEVTCNAVPVKGRISYDARQQRAEFIPHNTLYPGVQYTVVLVGRAVTTGTCTHSANIKNAEFHFKTTCPPPKNIGVRLKGSGSEDLDQIEIANYFDLFNSLIVWSTRKWGCSGEYITGMFTENDDGKLHPLKTDQDVLNLKEKEVIIVEIKD